MQNYQALEKRTLKFNQLTFINLPNCPKHERMLRSYYRLYRQNHSYEELKKSLTWTKVIKVDKRYLVYEDFYWLRVLASEIPHLELKAVIIPEHSYQRATQTIVMRQLTSGLYSLNTRLLPEFVRRHRDLGFIRSRHKVQDWAELLEVSRSSLYYPEPQFILHETND